MSYTNYRTKTIELTPEVAQKFLDANYEEQRNLTVRKSAEMARDIVGGRWNNNFHSVSPIMFSPDGKMLNGQHRCKAVILADKSIIVDVMYGVPKEFFVNIDGGNPRAVHQFIHQKNASIMVSVARFGHAVECGSSLTNAFKGIVDYIGKSSVAPSRNELLDYIDDNSELLSFCSDMASKMAKAFNGKGSKAGFADAFWTIKFFDPALNNAYIERFVDTVRSDMIAHPAIASGKNMALGKLIQVSGEMSAIKSDWWYAFTLAMWNAQFSKKKKISNSDVSKTYAEYDKLFNERRMKNE